MKEKKRKKLEVAPLGFEPAPQLPPAQNLALGHATTKNNNVLKFKVLKYFSLLFTLFEPCGAVLIMNSKIHLRKIA